MEVGNKDVKQSAELNVHPSSLEERGGKLILATENEEEINGPHTIPFIHLLRLLFTEHLQCTNHQHRSLVYRF